MIVACAKQVDITTTHLDNWFMKHLISNDQTQEWPLSRNKSCPRLTNLPSYEFGKKNKEKSSNNVLNINPITSLQYQEQKIKDDWDIKLPMKQWSTEIQHLNIKNSGSQHSWNNLANITNIKGQKDCRKSNLSNSSFGKKNYLLKSDVCKSTGYNHRSFNRWNQEENNPWLQYYGIEKSNKNVENDYWLFVKKNQLDCDKEVDVNNFFNKNDAFIMKNKKEIWISTYVDDEETGEYIDENSEENEEDEEYDILKDPVDIHMNTVASKDEETNRVNVVNSDINKNSNCNSNSNIKAHVNTIQSMAEQTPVNVNNIKIKTTSNNITPRDIGVHPTTNITGWPHIPNMNSQNKMEMNYGNFYNINPQNQMYPQMNANYLMQNYMLMNMKQHPNMQQLYNQPLRQNNFNPLLQQQSLMFQPKSNITNYMQFNDQTLAKYSSIWIKEQSGCRFIQEKIQSDPKFANNILFQHLCLTKNINELICDQFGNYLFQVLIDVLSFENWSEFWSCIQNCFYKICISPHGTRVMQKIIEKIHSSPIWLNKFIFNISNDNFIEIMKDPYGNHVVQKYLCSVHNYTFTAFIYEKVFSNFLTITNSKHGVCVVQKLISEGEPEQRIKVISYLTKHLEKIITDQFGNYLIQYTLTTNDIPWSEWDDILNYIIKNIGSLCKSKFSANIIEKCFEKSKKWN